MKYELVNSKVAISSLDRRRTYFFSFSPKIYLHIVEKKNHELIPNKDSCV